MSITKGRSLTYNNKILRPNSLFKLQRLFEKKQWPVFDSIERSLFSKFCRTLELLTDSQQVFLIDLTEQFLWIKGTEYENMLLKIVRKLRESLGDVTIYFVPCKPSVDFCKVKSSDYVWYTLRDNIFRYELDLGKIEMKNNFQEVNEQQLIDGNAVMVLVDDFIGTGGTCWNTLTDIRQFMPHLADYNAIKVLALVAQQDGINSLSTAGVEIFYDVLAPKGIRDCGKPANEIIRMYSLMDSIEARIPGLNNTCKRGYNMSEALVSMVRCPNNTFPIYWYIPNVSPYERIQ